METKTQTQDEPSNLKLFTKMLLWAATLLSILTSTARALNLGYIVASYTVSSGCYVIFICYAENRRLAMLNGFYLLTSLIAIYRWL